MSMRATFIRLPRRTLPGAAALLVALAVAACGSDSPEAGTSSTPDGHPTSHTASTDAGAVATADATEAAATAARQPSGVITYRVDDHLTSVRADAPEEALPAPVVSERPRPAYAPEDGEAVYPSPDGEAEVRVQRDETGTYLEVYVADTRVSTTMIAGPDDPEAVVGSKIAARAVEGVPLAVAWSPDNRHIAFGSLWGDPFFLGIIRVGSWTVSYLPVEGGYVGELAWSPSGDLLGVSTYELDRHDHTVLLFNPVTFVAERLMDGCVITWSPDGDFIAFHREPAVEPGVWIASVRDDLLIPVTRDEAAFPVAWTDDAAGERNEEIATR